MKRIILIFALCFAILVLKGEEVPILVAKEYAYKFMVKANSKNMNISEISVFQKGDKPYTYIVNFKPEGWILLSADDRVPAVLAFSETGYFNTQEIVKLPFFFWFKNYEQQIKHIISSNKLDVHPSWGSIEFSQGSDKTIQVQPLIEVKWDQGAGWNALCPADEKGPGGHAYAGCVAVAMAQCMSVYKHPTHGYGQKTYTDNNYGYQFADFSKAEYKWDLMNAESANEHVAFLLFHLGVSVSMSYGYDGSGAFSSSVPSSIKTYFDYTNQAKYVKRSDYSDVDWSSLLIEELRKGHPVYYSGDGGDGEAGHAFNIDGVNDQGLFHLNWGWSGQYNGYYSISSLAPGANNFSYNQEAVINFTPRDHRPYDITLSNNSIKENLPVNSEVGTLLALDETPDDTHSFQVIAPPDLDGNPGSVPFKVEDNKLITTQILSYNTINSYEIIVKTTDKDGNIFEKTFLIFVVQNPMSNIAIEEFQNLKITNKNNTIWFSFTNSYEGGYSVKVFDISGRLVVTKAYYKTVGSTSNSIFIDDRKLGLYLVSFDFTNYKMVKKIMINL